MGHLTKWDTFDQSGIIGLLEVTFHTKHSKLTLKYILHHQDLNPGFFIPQRTPPLQMCPFIAEAWR